MIYVEPASNCWLFLCKIPNYFYRKDGVKQVQYPYTKQKDFNMGHINRDDMLELTRRMTSARSNLVRIAGAYIDEEGYIDGTFNSSCITKPMTVLLQRQK